MRHIAALWIAVAGFGTAPISAQEAPTAESSAKRIELEAAQITGNRELPRVLHIVPWKRADLEELGGKPVGSVIDEVLTPVDRDVFRREIRYYHALQPDTAAPAFTPERKQ